MFKEVETAVKEYTEVAKVLVKKTEQFHNMEDTEYAIQDELEEFKAELEDKYRKDLTPKLVADEQRCKCCESVLTEAVVNPKELAKLEKEMFERIDSHPRVKLLEEQMETASAAYKALDREIDTMADVIYELEGKIKRAFEGLNVPEAWFSFHTSLV